MPKRKKYPSSTHRNFFPVYGRTWGQTLMVEARQRGMTRTELVRRAVGDYLIGNPVVEGSGNDRQTRDR